MKSELIAAGYRLSYCYENMNDAERAAETYKSNGYLAEVIPGDDGFCVYFIKEDDVTNSQKIRNYIKSNTTGYTYDGLFHSHRGEHFSFKNKADGGLIHVILERDSGQYVICYGYENTSKPYKVEKVNL